MSKRCKVLWVPKVERCYISDSPFNVLNVRLSAITIICLQETSTSWQYCDSLLRSGHLSSFSKCAMCKWHNVKSPPKDACLVISSIICPFKMAMFEKLGFCNSHLQSDPACILCTALFNLFSSWISFSELQYVTNEHSPLIHPPLCSQITRLHYVSLFATLLFWLFNDTFNTGNTISCDGDESSNFQRSSNTLFFFPTIWLQQQTASPLVGQCANSDFTSVGIIPKGLPSIRSIISLSVSKCNFSLYCISGEIVFVERTMSQIIRR